MDVHSWIVGLSWSVALSLGTAAAIQADHEISEDRRQLGALLGCRGRARCRSVSCFHEAVLRHCGILGHTVKRKIIEQKGLASQYFYPSSLKISQPVEFLHDITVSEGVKRHTSSRGMRRGGIGS